MSSRRNRLPAKGLCLALFALFAPGTAQAQISFDVLGPRALGMGGAFVAVADDPNAVFWNPAGLVKGAPASVTIGWDRFQFRDPNAIPVPGAGRVSTRTLAIGTWPLGISFIRSEASGIVSASGTMRAEVLMTTQLGFTVLQSLGESVVLGATLKVLRGAAAIAPAIGISTDSVLDAVLDAETAARTAFDFDIGVLAGTDRLRAGFAFKNLRRLRFDTIGGTPIHLERRARVGLAALPRDGVTLAIDVDLDTADPLVGLRRTIALGGETRLGVRLTVRGGLRWQRGETRPIGALGGSVRLRQGFWLDGYVTHGQSGDQGFGVALRAGS
jgi:hypothetical protein